MSEKESWRVEWRYRRPTPHRGRESWTWRSTNSEEWLGWDGWDKSEALARQRLADGQAAYPHYEFRIVHITTVERVL